MSGFKFLLVKGLVPQRLNLLGLFYAGKQAALKLAANENLTPHQILIRVDAHPWTYRTNQSGLVRDKLHFTMDIKDAAMISNNTHLTVHAYLTTKSNTDEVTNMWDVDVVVPKKTADNDLKIEKDEYFDKRKQKHVNNWNMANLQEFDEPTELSRVHLGDNFITVLPPDYDPKVKTTQEAVGEEMRVRKALEEKGQKLLGEI